MDRLMHPPFSRLSDFIDGDLSRRRMTAVSRHLLRCSKCQETVDSLRLIQSVTQRLRSAPLQEQHRARVSGLADRENDLSGSIAPGGAEVDGQTPVGFEKHRNAVAAVGSVFLVVAGLFLIRTDAHSDTSELSFNNVRPTAGDIVRVKYVPDGRFSFGDKVVLRGEVYERDRPLSDQRERFVFLDTLERTHDSEYRGEFTWGIDDVVYVEFAVESPEADAVDRDPNWHLRSVGEQTLAALRQQYRRALSRHDTREAMQVAVEMTKDFPDEPDAWDALQVSLDRLFGLERIPETLSVRIDQAFWKMVAQVNDPEWASSRRVGELYWWALSRDDSVPQVGARMRQYAVWTHYRIVDRISDLSADPTSGNLGLERLEALWQTAGKHPHIASEAFGRAVAMRDAEHALIWGDRLVALRESERASVVSRLLELTSTRDSAMAMLKHGLEVLVEDGESLRPLSQTRTDHSLTIAAKRRQFARLLGTSLIEDGNIDEGLSYLELGLEAGSDLTAVRAAARGYLSRGDTLEATQLLARVALEEELLENQSGAAVLGRRLAGSAWSRRLADAADAIDLATALDLRRVRPPAEFLQVRDMNGDSMSLGAAILGKTNVVAFAWLNTPSKPTLDTLSVHAGRWLKQGATTYVLTDEYPDSIFKVEASTYPNLVWLHDVHGDARRYFDSWRVPDYFVVNNDGSAQFHSTKLDDIPRKLAYLKAHPEYSAGYVAPEE